MKDEHSSIYSKDFDDEIDLKEILYILWEGKWIIISLTSLMSIIGVIYSLLLPNVYESKALLVPAASTNSSISGNLGKYSSLAGIAGIALPAVNNQDNSIKAIKKIRSLSFFENNILKEIYLPNLMALKSWNVETNTLVYDKNIFNKKTNSWLSKKSNIKKIPSTQKSFEVFNKKHLRLIEDKQSGFITLSIKHQSPYIAKQWVELVVSQVNNFYRQKDKSESEKSVRYLNKQISMTGLSEIKDVLALLMQEEIKKLALIESNEFYVFEYIDPPAVMEKKSEPRRSIICILAALLGGMLSILLVIIRHYYFKKI